MAGNTYNFVLTSDTFATWLARTNNLVSELNNKVIKFDVSNSGKKFILSANLIANGATSSFKANSTFTSSNTNVLGKTLFAKANTNLDGANTNIRGGTLLVRSNTNFNGTNTNIKSTSLLITSNIIHTGNTLFASNGSIVVPKGTTAQRTASRTGAFRYNTQLLQYEGYSPKDGWFKVGGGGLQFFKPIKTSYTANTEDRIAANTKGGSFPIYLPPTPTDKMVIEILDAENNFANTNLIVARNGSTIEGVSANLVIDVSGSTTTIQYNAVNATWQVYTSGVITALPVGGSILAGSTDNARFVDPLPITTANTNFTGGKILVTANTFISKPAATWTNRGRTTAQGANTDIKGGSLYVASNTVITGATTVANTFVALKGSPIRTVGGNNVTIALSDNGKFVSCTNSTSAMNIHIPTNAAIAFPTGAEISFFNYLTSSTKRRLGFSKTAGVTLLSKGNANSVANTYSSASIKKIASDTWILVGDLS